MTEKLVYRIQEVCTMLCLSRSRIYQLFEEGRLVKNSDGRVTAESIKKYYLSTIPKQNED